MSDETEETLKLVRSEARLAGAEAVLQIRTETERLQERFRKSYGLVPALVVISIVAGFLFNEKRSFEAFVETEKARINERANQLAQQVADLEQDLKRARAAAEQAEEASAQARVLAGRTHTEALRATQDITAVKVRAQDAIGHLKSQAQGLLDAAVERVGFAERQAAKARNSAYELFIHFDAESELACPRVTEVVSLVEGEGFIVSSVAPQLAVDRQQIVYRRSAARDVAFRIAELLKTKRAGQTDTKLVESREANPRSFLIKVDCSGAVG